MEKQRVNYTDILERDRVVDIADLLKELFHRIWLIAIIAVVFAAGAAGYKYIKDSRASEKEMPSSIEVIETAESIKSRLSDSEISGVETVVSLAESLEQQKEYFNNSIYMQVDGLHEDRVSMLYCIKSTDDTSDIADMYVRYINNGGLTADLKEKGIKIESQYLKELVYASAKTDEVYVLDSQILDTMDKKSTLSVSVIHNEQEQCEELAQAVAECIQDFCYEASDAMGAHELVMVDQYYAQVVDESVWNRVLSYSNNIATTETRLAALKDGLNEDQQTLLETYTAVEDVEEESTSADEVPVKLSKKYAMAGAVIGIIIACFLLLLWYILRGTVNCAQELQSMYNLCVLGEAGRGNKRNILLKKQNGEENIDLLSAKLRNMCHVNGYDKVLIVNEDTSAEWIDAVRSELQAANIHLEVVANLNSVDALHKMAEYKQVILTKRLKKDLHRDLVKEIETCMEQQMEIIGVVVL